MNHTNNINSPSPNEPDTQDILELAEDVKTDQSSQADASGSQHEPPSVEMLLEQLQLANAQKDANWNKYLSAEAEMMNVRHRAERQVSEAHKFAIDKFVRELLPLIDSMELGMQAALKNSDENNELQKFIEGSDLLHKMFLSTLAKFGVTPIIPVGEKLNPEHHQAITMQPSSEYASGTVMQVVQKGYLLNERLIRPAMVIVAQ